MSGGLTTGLVVGALLRRTAGAGGFAMVLHKGEASAGGILIACLERGRPRALLERLLSADFTYAWQRVGPDPEDGEAQRDYLQRRRQRDPDLWVVELDIADAERFAVESLIPN